LKPEINKDQQDSDWWVRSRVVGGVVSGLYGDMLKTANDAFPQSARQEAVARHLDLWLSDTFRDAQQSVGSVVVSGVTGTTVPSALELVYDPNGNTYLTTESIVLSATTGLVAVQSVNTGQAQNLLSGAVLTISSPPGGLNSTATVAAGGLADGRDEETTEEAANRVLARVRQPTAGGTESDYQNFALSADPSVTGANVLRFVYGLGTVGVVITAGTTDIDSAVDNDEAIVRVPSDALLETVRDYVDARNPVTDCLHMLKPQEIPQDVTFRVRWSEGYTGATIPTGQTKTLLELLEREINRALYKVPTGGRHIGASGYIIASEIEEVVDLALSASPYQTGTLAQVILDRAVEDLTPTGANRLMRPTETVVPGTITIIEES
jgi:uncharacterized phage protein gp47/JayE